MERDRWGLRARVQVGPRRKERRFPAETPIKEIQRWRDEQRVELRRLARVEHVGPFSAMVEAYLETVTHLPTVKERRYQMRLWSAEFGARAPESIKATEIAAVLSRWLAEGKAISTVRHRRAALSRCYRQTFPESGLNPVAGAKLPREAEPAIRALSYETIERILAALPDQGRAGAGAARPAVSLTKARLAVLAYTGLPAKLLAQLQPGDVDWDRGLITVMPRRKGHQVAGSILPLTAKGLSALRAFAAVGAWGAFSTSSMRQSFRRACKTAGVPLARVYDLRHAFGAAVYAASGDILAVSRLLTHSTPKTTERYVRAADTARMAAAAAAAFGAIGGPESGVAAPGARAISGAVPRGSTRKGRRKTA